jgi:hypothetical protein
VKETCVTCGKSDPEVSFGLMIVKDDCDRCFCHRLPKPPGYIARKGLLVPNPVEHVVQADA